MIKFVIKNVKKICLAISLVIAFYCYPILFLFWFFLSLYLVYHDKTISTSLRIIGELTNIFAIGYISNTMTNEIDNPLYLIVGFVLLAWYIYYTPQDARNANYTILERWTYVTIDICFIIYLFINQKNAIFAINWAQVINGISNFISKHVQQIEWALIKVGHML